MHIVSTVVYWHWPELQVPGICPVRRVVAFAQTGAGGVEHPAHS